MTSAEMTRIEWTESRRDAGLFFVIAEWNGAAWEFWDRHSWEVRWFPLKPTPERVAKAETLQDRQPAAPADSPRAA